MTPFERAIEKFTLAEVRLARQKCVYLMREARVNGSKFPLELEKYQTQEAYNKKQFNQCVEEIKKRKLEKKIVDMSERSC